MADEPAPAPAEEQPTAPAAAPPKDAAKPPPAAPADDRAARLTTLIRNGFSNTALSRDQLAWESFEQRLPDVVAAIIKEA